MNKRFRHQSARRKRKHISSDGSRQKDLKRPDAFYIRDIETHIRSGNKKSYKSAIQQKSEAKVPSNLRAITGMVEITNIDFFSDESGNISLDIVSKHFSIQREHIVFADIFGCW